MDLTGKKLLILGGGATSKDIVNAAKVLGIYTIVTDWYDTKRSPAKLIADEYWNEEIFKPDLLAELIKKHHIDGVITGFTDSYLLQYQRLCELSGLPCYATKEVFEITLDKALLRNFVWRMTFRLFLNTMLLTLTLLPSLIQTRLLSNLLIIVAPEV